MKKLIALFVLLICVIGVLFYLGRQGLHIVPTAQVLQVPTTPPSVTMGQFSIKISKQKIVSGGTTFQVNKNDEVVFHIISDAPGTLHLLGYEQNAALTKNKEVTLSFLAAKQGKYAFEWEATHTQLGILTVKP